LPRRSASNPARNRPTAANVAARPALRGREILVCVCGGIAAYKTAALVSALVQRGCGVTVAMTRAARRFVGPVTFEALTGRRVLVSLWHGGEPGDIQHLALSERADLIVVAPATANLLGKLANGIADDLVSALLLGAACPVLLAPAMNARMWQHAAVQRNLTFLRESGFAFVGPEEGWQACRTVGVGRMSEPETLLEAIHAALPPRRRRDRERPPREPL